MPGRSIIVNVFKPGFWTSRVTIEWLKLESSPVISIWDYLNYFSKSYNETSLSTISPVFLVYYILKVNFSPDLI